MRRLHHELGRDHGNSSQGLGPVDIPHVIAVSLILHGIWHLAYPRLSTDHPAFIGRHELILRVHGAQMKLDLIATFRIYGRAAIGAEIPLFVRMRGARNAYRLLRENRGGIKQGTVMLATAQAMAETHAQRRARGFKSDGTTQAAAFCALHVRATLGRARATTHRRRKRSDICVRWRLYRCLGSYRGP